MYNTSMAWTVRVDEEDRIRKEEAYKNRIAIAKGMKSKGFETETFIELKGLTKEDIERP